MGKFSGVLVASDYDNTLAFTEEALIAGLELPEISDKNRAALEYFVSEGGIFCVATGRALPSFEDVFPTLPTNGPTILFNGAAIYDFTSHKYLHTAFLPDVIRDHIQILLDAYPGTAMEIYHDDNSMHALNPNEITEQHLHLTHSPSETIFSIEQAPLPISKVLLEECGEKQQRLVQFLKAQPWGGNYEIVTSSNYLTEITAKGANKGGAIRKLMEILHIDAAHVYTIGDHANDIPMLQCAKIPFAPENAIDSVKKVPGVHVLPHCKDHAIAALIHELDKIY